MSTICLNVNVMLGINYVSFIDIAKDKHKGTKDQEMDGPWGTILFSKSYHGSQKTKKLPLLSSKMKNDEDDEDKDSTSKNSNNSGATEPQGLLALPAPSTSTHPKNDL